MTPMFCGFAGIFGFSARLTGGGMGDFGRTSVLTGAGLAAEVGTSIGAVSTRSIPGVGVLVEDLLLCCDTNSRTFARADISALSGDRDGLREKNVLGGDLGDST